MKILSIETSCDETGAAITSREPKSNHVKILSNVVVSSLVLHSKTGGIVPEVAAREQLKFIIPVIKQALIESSLYPLSSKVNLLSSTIYRPKIDAIAVTVGPGLIGSLLVGIETAKTLAYIWKKPIIPVSHLLGHIYANFIQTTDDRKLKADSRKTVDTTSVGSVQSLIRHPSSVIRLPTFPALSLLVSGGHTDLFLLKNHKNIKWLGGTLDDAAGEAFDKIGKLLNLPYPGGPAVEKASERGIVGRFTFPRPMIGSKDFNFSFSGLKAAVLREVLRLNKQLNKQQVADISLASQKSIIDVLVRKTLKAAKKYNVKSILLGGGVASNKLLKKKLKVISHELGVKFFAPAKNLCTDNAAMIGACAAFHPEKISGNKITANPELYF